MAYSQKTDITDQLDEAVLIQLTDDDGAGAVDDDKVTRAIADADSTIDAYCQDRYTIPLSPVPDKIRQVSVDVAIYNLFSRRGDSIPEVRKDRYSSAIKFMEQVNAGKIKLGSATPSQANTRDSVSIESNTRVFTRDDMSGF